MTFEIIVKNTDDAQGQKSLGLVGELCIFHAREAKSQLFELIERGTDYEVDLAHICEIDTAGLQVLLMAKRAAAGVGCKLTFINHSDPLLEAIDLLNLGRDFGDPMVITARDQEDLHESR